MIQRTRSREKDYCKVSNVVATDVEEVCDSDELDLKWRITGENMVANVRVELVDGGNLGHLCLCLCLFHSLWE